MKIKIEKNVYVPSVSYNKLSWEKALKILCKGYKIIFVTKNKKLYGCITVGDIKRMFYREGEWNRTFIKQLINKNCKQIVFKDEIQAKKEAEQIFEKYKNIHNIPVINEWRQICFQYQTKERTLKDELYEHLYKLDYAAAIENFLRWYGNRNYLIVGFDETIMQYINIFFRKKALELKIYASFNICKLENICNRKKQDFVICIDEVTKLYYLLFHEEWESGIICLQEISAYESFIETDIQRLLKVEEKDIVAWINLYGYENIFFNSSNCYTLYLKSLMEKCNLKVYQKLPKPWEKDIVMISCAQQYKNTMTVAELAFVFEAIIAYRYITGKDISSEIYVDYFLLILQRSKLIYQYKRLNKLDDMIIDKIRKNMFVSNYISDPKKYTQDGKNIINQNTISRFVLSGLLNKCIIEKLKYLTKKVYFHIHINSNRFPLFPDRTLEQVVKGNKEFLNKEFCRDFYGEEYREVDEIINNLMERKDVNLHTCYSKLQSNYTTKYVSTDIHGDMTNINEPEKYYGTVYLIGSCLYWGAVIPNKHTSAFYLQKKFNINGNLYKVKVLLGLNGLWRKYMKIIEYKIQVQDIIVLQPDVWDAVLQLVGDENLICTNWEEVNRKISTRNWYWDVPPHCNYQAHEIIANQIYEKIKKDLSEEYFPEFSLEHKLNQGILLYLNDIKHQLKYCLPYKKFINEYKNEKRKIGAIVMNCNPFTFGHRYLIETAAKITGLLYVFVVEEDKSEFSFQERFFMVKGTAHISNVIVLPSGKFMISQNTFSGYFLKDKADNNSYDSFLDLKIFVHYIAPELNIGIRFVGEEPFDKVTAQYNKDMKVILEEQNIIMIEIPRLTVEGHIISATTVRKLLKEKNWKLIDKLIPESTKVILKQKIN